MPREASTSPRMGGKSAGKGWNLAGREGVDCQTAMLGAVCGSMRQAESNVSMDIGDQNYTRRNKVKSMNVFLLEECVTKAIID
jgi:hypothetical protein